MLSLNFRYLSRYKTLVIKSKAKKQYIFIVGHTFLAGLALTFSVHFIHLFSFYCCFILLYIKLQKIF